MATRSELSDFLAGIERRAFKQAMYALREEEAALDAVQDAMMKLAEKYGERPAAEFPMLFQRILQNVIRDWFRRSKVRSIWTTLLSNLSPDDEDDHDPLESIEVAQDSPSWLSPEQSLSQTQVMEVLEREISRLPPRQREAFLMRYWEDMDIAETAAAMGCSEGSVKTHCSRAVHTLAAALKARGIGL
ncbi:MAG: RNA polymerase sigma factor [Rhodocyclaceae bacterium]|nr:RNA polymerase sigma factor [Rhodocyclaceae bacterium]MBX3667434.1 RNA polymerase sigma factor [Rhodocyclaceae bacterium]